MSLVLRFALVAFALAWSASAQDRATLTGTIFDPSRAVISGAKLELISSSTGAIRVVESGAAGEYRIPLLPIGGYTLRVSLPGFRTSETKDLVLQVGQTRTFDVTLDPSSDSTVITVEAEASAINQSSSDLSKVVSDADLRKLPVNGRDWNAFLSLAPGAINSGDGTQRAIRFVGRSNNDNNYTFDGIDATGVKEAPTLVSLRTVISNDAVAEFKVSSALYSAEYGFYMGGQVSFVSKAGSNEFRGSVFEFLRNDVFDARRFVDLQKPPFRLNQFGGSFGGPVIKNRTFFFANFEALRQRLGQTAIASVPTPALRARILATSPVLRPILDFYPSGTRNLNANVDEAVQIRRQAWEENSGMFRVDHQFNAKNTVYVRYNTANGEITTPQSVFNFNRQQTLATHNAVIQYQRIFSPTTLNELKIGLNRANNRNFVQSPLRESVGTTGLATVPGASGGGDPGTTYSVIDSFSKIMGRHSLKTGFEIRKVQVNIYQNASYSVAYPNIEALVNNRVDSYGINGEFGTRGVRTEVFMGYIQDEWKIKPNLTANLGLRYEFYMPLYEKYGRARIWALECGGICAPGSDLYNPDYNNFDPRVSFAWSPAMFKNRTTIRVGGGIYHQMGQFDDLLGPIESTNIRATLTGRDVAGLNYPVAPFTARAVLSNDTPRALQHTDRRDFYSYQYGLFIDQRLPFEFGLTVGYNANQGRRLLERTYQNVRDLTTGRVPLPDFGIIDQKLTGSTSNFHGLQVSLNRRFSKGFLFATQYMWSKSMNDGAVGSDEASYAQNVNCRACERSLSQFDIRHNLVTNGSWELPFGRGKRFLREGIGAAIFGGWDLSGIMTARAGRPIDVSVTRTAAVIPDGNNRSRQRPNYVAGQSLTPAAGQTATRWINFAAFADPAPGTFGNLGRNILTGPGLFQFDSALTRRQRITERIGLSFRFEVFNLTNRAQFGQPAANITAGPEQFGRITAALNSGATGTGTSRQMQFMLRLDF